MAYRDIFPKPHTFLAVVHVKDFDQAERNINIAIENGADGVFLIDHNTSRTFTKTGHLLATYQVMRERLPDDTWIGLNFLGLGLDPALGNLPHGCPGLWTDHGGIYEAEHRDLQKSPSSIGAEIFEENRKETHWEFLWFGGVAFKYQTPVKDLPGIAKLATQFMDVIVTSGERTASAPSVRKLAIIREAVGTHPVANASGTKLENVHLFKPHVDCFLVASSILKRGSDYEFDPLCVHDMHQAIHS